MTSDWFCIQLGAREHYAIPRAVHQQCRLAGLLTEAWAQPGAIAGLLPSRLLRRVRERFHPDLVTARVADFTFSWLLFEARHRRSLHGWDLIMERNRWFQRRVLTALQSAVRRQQVALADSRRVLFAYSYAALEPFRWAKAQGWTTVLGQIDPGPVEAEIVADEHQRYPGLASQWQAPPPNYWTDWRAECELADVIVVNSEWSRKGLAGGGVATEKVHVVPLIYENAPSAAPPRAYPDRFSAVRPLRVLFLGQVNLRKGVARVLEAARRLRGEPIEWWLIGPRDFEPSPAELAEPHWRWIGPVRRGEVGRYYDEADVFLFPTLSDGFGLTQLEAQARRLPVIASRYCGTVVHDGKNGFLLPDVSSEAIAAVVLECVRNPTRLAAMSVCSHVAGEFSPVCVAAQLSKLVGPQCLSVSPPSTLRAATTGHTVSPGQAWN